MLRSSYGLLLALGAGCAAPTPPAQTTRAQSSPPTPAVSVAPSTSAKPVAASASGSAASPEPLPLDAHFERVLTVPVRSIALGEGSRIALLADAPYVGDARGLHPLPLPPGLEPKPDQSDDTRIFFGRDNEPRIMGTRRSQAGEAPIYWRHANGVWRDGREEIGQLGSATHGGLWGVLGSLDPELVCRAGAVCIIKRTTGWTTAPAGPAPRRVELWNGTLWGLDASGLANIDARGWSLRISAPTWVEPRAAWASADEAWVATARELWRFHERAWSVVASPIAEPAAFWATSPDSVWLVGKSGAAHFDGKAWRAASVGGALAVVRGRSDADLWLGGNAGLFHRTG